MKWMRMRTSLPGDGLPWWERPERCRRIRPDARRTLRLGASLNEGLIKMS